MGFQTWALPISHVLQPFAALEAEFWNAVDCFLHAGAQVCFAAFLRTWTRSTSLPRQSDSICASPRPTEMKACGVDRRVEGQSLDDGVLTSPGADDENRHGR